MKGKRGLFFVLVLSLVFIMGALTPAATAQEKILVGSKGFTEQVILGNMVSLLLESNGFKVDRKIGLGGTVICHEALVRGDISVYVEYTGTGLTTILKRAVLKDPEEVYQVVKKDYEDKFKLTWLKPWGFNNTYCIVMRKADAERLKVKKISDLKLLAGDLVFGGTIEFLARPDGVPGLVKHYGLKFKDQKGMDPGLVYKAIAENQVNVISGFATDGRIPAFNLVVLEDDLKFFPPYFAAPVVRMDLLTKAPKAADALNVLAGKISDDAMAALNYTVDGKKQEAEEVAKNFLKSQGLVK
ncbi:MAG: glycine betaine ABC transporter substrate-binding protein [Syntrophales bacterium]|nr:glycine betaine ABC transporter substrate-binding protein [Syntrophales bacterium]